MQYSLEIIVNPAFDPVCLQSKVYISYSTIVHVVLVEDIIEALVVIQVEQNNCTACLHADFNLVCVTTDLHEHVPVGKYSNQACLFKTDDPL